MLNAAEGPVKNVDRDFVDYEDARPLRRGRPLQNRPARLAQGFAEATRFPGGHLLISFRITANGAKLGRALRSEAVRCMLAVSLEVKIETPA